MPVTYDFEGKLYEFPDDVTQEEALQFIDQQSQAQPNPADSAFNNPNMTGEVGQSHVSGDWAPQKSPLPKEADAANRPLGTQDQSLEGDHSVGPMGDMGYAALDEIGSFLGIGAEAWEQVKRSSPLGALFGSTGGPETVPPGQGIAMFKEALRAAGIPQQQVDNAAGRFGSNLVWNVIMTGLGIGAGRGLLAGTTNRTLQAGTRELASHRLGQALSLKPGEQIASAVGGSATQTYAEELNGEGPVESFVGYLPGMWAGGRTGRGLKSAWDWATRKDATEPIIRPFANPLQAKMAADERVARDLTNMDKLTRSHVLGDKTGGGVAPWNERAGVRTSRMSNEVAQRRLEESREYAEDTIRQVEDRHWDGVMKDTPADTQKLIDNVMDFSDELRISGTDLTTPQKFIDQILKLEPAVPPKKVQGLIRDIYSEIRRVKKDPTFSGDKGAYIANLNRLEDYLRETMEENATNPTLLEEARAITRNRKARFNDGPMGEAKYLEGQGTTTIDTPKGEKRLDFRRDWSAPLIARTSDGPTQLQAAHQMLESLGVKSTLADDFENALRADYVAAVEQTDDLGQIIYDPRKAKAWMDKNAPNLGAWKSLLRDFQDTTALIAADAMEKAAIRRGVIARVANSTEASFQTKINTAFSSANSEKEIKDLTAAFSIDQKTGKRLPSNHDNIEAWEYLAVNSFVKAAKGDGAQMAELLKHPIWRKNLQTAFTNNPDRLKRLEQVVARAVILAKEGEKQDMRGLVRNTSILLSGVMGAKFGTLWGTGSIQVPGYTAKAARGLIGGFLDKVLPQTPGEKLWWAIQTPEGYNWMMNRVPDTLEGTRKMVKQGRRIYALLNTQTHEKTRQWLDEWGVRPR